VKPTFDEYYGGGFSLIFLADGKYSFYENIILYYAKNHLIVLGLVSVSKQG
jgi:hypothetical protein